MTGKQWAILQDMKNPEIPEEEKWGAVDELLQMPTINSITKRTLLDVIRWLCDGSENDTGGEPVGHWRGVSGDDTIGGGIVYGWWECSNCGQEECGAAVPVNFRFCRRCGAKMIEEARLQ